MVTCNSRVSLLNKGNPLFLDCQARFRWPPLLPDMNYHLRFDAVFWYIRKL
jgi:hypothetical protein